MTAAVANRPLSNKGQAFSILPPLQRFPVEASTTLLAGIMAGPDAAGNLVDAGTAGCQFIAGVTKQQYPNVAGNPFSNPPSGAAGSIIAEVMLGVFPMFQSGTTTITNLHIGFPCYAADNQTVSLNSAAGPFAGYVYGIDTNPQTLGQVLVLFVSPLANSKGGEIIHQQTILPLAALQALTSGTPFNLGAALPVGAVVLGYDVNVQTLLSGGGLSAATLTLQGAVATGDAAGALMASQNLFAGAGLKTGVGSNAYPNRGGQQIQGTITATGAAMAAITAGAITIDLYYAITG